MLHPFGEELKIWFYTWEKVGAKEEVEELLSRAIEKIILNPYPLLEKSSKEEGYSLMIYAALDSAERLKDGKRRSKRAFGGRDEGFRCGAISV